MADEFKIKPDPIEPNFLPLGLEPLKFNDKFQIDDEPAYNDKPVDQHLPINWDDVSGIRKPSDRAINASEVTEPDTSQTVTLGETLVAGDPIRFDTDGKVYHVFESGVATYDTDYGQTYDDPNDLRVGPTGATTHNQKLIKMSDNKLVSLTATISAGTVKVQGKVITVSGRNIGLDSVIAEANFTGGVIFSSKKGMVAARLTDSLFVVVPNYHDADTRLKVIAGKINIDNTITWGSFVEIASDVLNGADKHFDICRLDNNKFLVAFIFDTTADVIRLVAGTVSGTTITLDEANQEDLAEAGELISLEELGTDKYIITYKDPGVNEDLVVSVGTVSTTTPSTDEVNQINVDANQVGEEISTGKLEDNKAVIHYRRSTATGDSSSRSRAVIISSPVTTPTAGTSVEISDDIGTSPNVEMVKIAVINETTFVLGNFSFFGYSKTIICSVSGTTITIGTEDTAIIVDNNYNNTNLAPVDTIDRFMVMGSKGTDLSLTSLGVGIASSSTLHGSSYIGILKTGGAADSEQTATMIGGLSTIHSGLVIGATYYLKLSSGELTLDSTSSYRAGIAESATELRVLSS